MNITKYLCQTVTIHIDRPIGSRHPKYNYTYPINYGYVPNTLNTDGEEIDAYLLGVHEPVHTYEGVVIAIIHRYDDDDDKLVVAPLHGIFSDQQIRMLTEFQEKYFYSEIIR